MKPRACILQPRKMALPMIIQYAMTNWTSTIFYAIMASYGAQQIGGYGVSERMTTAGASVSMALYTACSVRVGNLLGQKSIERAKQAAWAGVLYSTATGLALALLMFLMRFWLAEYFSPTDLSVQLLIERSALPVAVFYFLNSVMYGMWAVLEAQSRPSIPTIGMVASEWLISVPLTWLPGFRKHGSSNDSSAEFREILLPSN